MTPDMLLVPEMRPFAIALGLVLGLVLLEVILLFLGLSLMTDEGGADFDADADVGIEPGFEPEADFDADAVDAADAPTAGPTGLGAFLSWLGLGHVPFAIWLAAFLTAFGLTGLALQAIATAFLGTPLAPMIASLIALLPALAVSSRFARMLGRLVPKFESTAISTRSYGGRRGVITVGTAKRGKPAQARFTDGHGNVHYTFVEPLDDDASLLQGTEIAILRLRDGSLRAIAIDDAPAGGPSPS